MEECVGRFLIVSSYDTTGFIADSGTRFLIPDIFLFASHIFDGVLIYSQAGSRTWTITNTKMVRIGPRPVKLVRVNKRERKKETRKRIHAECYERRIVTDSYIYILVCHERHEGEQKTRVQCFTAS